MKNELLVLGGAIVGGAVGYFGFAWLLHQGIYALVLPGGLVGLGGAMWQGKSILISVLCGLLALALGLFCEWHFRPFIDDQGLLYFISHLHQLQPFTFLMVGAGAFIGFWAPFRRIQDAKKG